MTGNFVIVMASRDEISGNVLSCSYSSEDWAELSGTDNVEEFSEQVKHLWIPGFFLLKHLDHCRVVAEDVHHLPLPLVAPQPGRHNHNIEFF